MNHHSVRNRIVWYDGTTTVPSSEIEEYIQYANTGKVFVDEMTDDLRQYNKFASDAKITTRESDLSITPKWLLPKYFIDMDLQSLIDQQLADEIDKSNFSDDETNKRIDRIDEEMIAYREFNLIPVLHAILYIINRFEEKDIVWGVGRGSSVSSYVLYLMKVHDVDSVEYDLDFNEFIR